MEVKIVKSQGCLMALLGVLTLGLGPLMVYLQQRQWPARLDAAGVTTRGGKFIPWTAFTRVTRTTTRVTLGAAVERYDLYAPAGHVIVPPGRLVNGQQVVAYLLAHLPAELLQA